MTSLASSPSRSSSGGKLSEDAPSACMADYEELRLAARCCDRRQSGAGGGRSMCAMEILVAGDEVWLSEESRWRRCGCMLAARH
eukprot:CAMPEP_0175895794 /NCGR_PEP_ID=MMETSP0107_2-20121207/50699_1 /TAXON_ID=195067 ORGANISM="Goniomonas pacifica, Strain CCMP1869" /NCGR_SAMPLE_ID=MMETSP0107_2 /ASSEMBLY_ACC=CAM_ASM_000203 /LENGTH=83 /DNA_ID=CAMNT_0017216945 /DNA_START=216 /DNA_END=468 /DNA_ORIENTATION=-